MSSSLFAPKGGATEYTVVLQLWYGFTSRLWYAGTAQRADTTQTIKTYAKDGVRYHVRMFEPSEEMTEEQVIEQVRQCHEDAIKRFAWRSPSWNTKDRKSKW